MNPSTESGQDHDTYTGNSGREAVDQRTVKKVLLGLVVVVVVAGGTRRAEAQWEVHDLAAITQRATQFTQYLIQFNEVITAARSHLQGFYGLGVNMVLIAVGPVCIAFAAHEKTEVIFWSYVRAFLVLGLLYMPMLGVACGFAGIIMAQMTTMVANSGVVYGDGSDIWVHLVMVILGPICSFAVVRAVPAMMAQLLQSMSGGGGSSFAAGVGVAMMLARGGAEVPTMRAATASERAARVVWTRQRSVAAQTLRSPRLAGSAVRDARVGQPEPTAPTRRGPTKSGETPDGRRSRPSSISTCKRASATPLPVPSWLVGRIATATQRRILTSDPLEPWRPQVRLAGRMRSSWRGVAATPRCRAKLSSFGSR